MKLFLDYYTRLFASSIVSPITVVQSVSFKRRDNDEIELVFTKGTQPFALPTGTTGQLGIKRANDYDGVFLAFSDSWTISGTAEQPLYVFRVNLNTVQINSIFEESADTLEAIPAMMEVTWTNPDGVTSTSTTITARIFNDVVSGDEGEPAELPLFYTAETSDFLATQAQAELGQNNTAWMSPLRTAQAIAALASPSGGGVSSWNDLTDKPTSFPPSTHTHTIAEVENLSTDLDTIRAVIDIIDARDVGVSSWNDLTDKPSTFPPATHTHAASDITSGTLAITRIPTGTTSTTVCLGNDARLSDARTPASHTHGNLSNAGAIGTASGVPIITGTNGVLQAGAFGTTAGTFAEGNHSHAGYVTTSGGITTIAVVATMPTTPDANTLYIVTA